MFADSKNTKLFHDFISSPACFGLAGLFAETHALFFCSLWLKSSFLIWSTRRFAMPQTAEVSQQIRAILDQSKGSDFLVKSVQELFSLLRKAGLMSSTTLPPLAVGVHPPKQRWHHAEPA